MIYDDGKFFRRIHANCWDPLVRIAEMDATNVQMQALSPVPVLFNYWAPGSDALETARFFNDNIAALVKTHPDRFVALGTLPMQEPALAVKVSGTKTVKVP